MLRLSTVALQALLVLVAPAALLLAPAPGTAGEAPTDGSVMIEGTVMDRVTGEPIRGVQVTLDNGGQLRTTTDHEGRFRLGPIPVADYLLVAEHPGYAPIRELVYPTGDEDVKVVLVMVPDPVELDPLVVTSGRQLPARIREFHDRRRQGFGQYLAPDDIEQLNAFHLTDALRELPALRVEPGRRGSASDDGISFRGRCAEVFVDGVRAAEGAGAVNELVSVADLYGVEVYTAAMAPMEFTTRTSCGVVALWTQPGGRDGDPFSGRRAGVFVGLVAAVAFIAF